MGNADRNAKCNLFPIFLSENEAENIFYNFYTVINVCVPNQRSLVYLCI